VAKILIISREEDVRNFTSRFFTERNFGVLETESVKEGLSIVGREEPDIVLLGIETPDSEGLDPVKAINSVNPKTRTIIISSIDDVEVMQRSLQSGAVAFLGKPILLSELMDIVVSNLRKSRSFFELTVEPKNE